LLKREEFEQKKKLLEKIKSSKGVQEAKVKLCLSVAIGKC